MGPFLAASVRTKKVARSSLGKGLLNRAKIRRFAKALMMRFKVMMTNLD